MAAIAAPAEAAWVLGPVEVAQVAQVAAIAAQAEVEAAVAASAAVVAVQQVALAVGWEAVREVVETVSCHGGACAAFAWIKSSI